MVESAFAQSIPKPSVPEFTLKYVDNSYDIPPTYGIDPYTGKNVVTQAAYHIQNKSIVVTIKNQPFVSYRNENNSVVGLFYSVRLKGHFQDSYGEPSSESYIYRSDSDYTSVYCGLNGNNGTDPFTGDFWLGGLEIPAGGQVDFQVKALIGHYTRVYGDFAPPFGQSYHDVFTGESSGWSNTQTLTIPTSSQTPDQTTEPTPSQTTESTSTNETSQTLQLAAIIGTIIAIVVVSAGLLVYFKKRNRKKIS